MRGQFVVFVFMFVAGSLQAAPNAVPAQCQDAYRIYTLMSNSDIMPLWCRQKVEMGVYSDDAACNSRGLYTFDKERQQAKAALKDCLINSRSGQRG